MQNQPDPDTPVQERRWLDRLRAAWYEARRSPRDKRKATELEAVGQERPEEASYRISTFDADERRRADTSKREPAEGRRQSRSRRAEATPDSDRFDDEAGR